MNLATLLFIRLPNRATPRSSTCCWRTTPPPTLCPSWVDFYGRKNCKVSAEISLFTHATFKCQFDFIASNCIFWCLLIVNLFCNLTNMILIMFQFFYRTVKPRCRSHNDWATSRWWRRWRWWRSARSRPPPPPPSRRSTRSTRRSRCRRPSCLTRRTKEVSVSCF